jgi:hypothetical protein
MYGAKIKICQQSIIFTFLNKLIHGASGIHMLTMVQTSPPIYHKIHDYFFIIMANAFSFA